MSVFISYNHNDSDFVDKLSLELIRNNIKVWKDKWQISAGDSLINEIESGLLGASYLVIVLSKNSVKSDWVRKELNAALIREIDDKKIKILPVLINDCEIPLFLREKLYVDFRKDFENGLKQILSAVSRKYNLDGGGRVNRDTTYYFDFSIDTRFENQKFFMDIDTISFDLEEDFSVLTQFYFESSTLPDTESLDDSFIKQIKTELLRSCATEFFNKPGRKVIPPDKVVKGKFKIFDNQMNTRFEVSHRVNRLGVKSTDSLVFDVGALFYLICDSLGIEYK
jgi:hypothetical protein